MAEADRIAEVLEVRGAGVQIRPLPSGEATRGMGGGKGRVEGDCKIVGPSPIASALAENEVR